MVELDEDVAEESTEDAPLPSEERRLVTQSYDLSVGTLLEQWNDRTLQLPDIQREYVWSNSKASRLIESLLLNVPIPVLYFAEGPEETYEVIDGHQRVASIARFLNNEFALSGLKVLADAEHSRKRFHQLPTSDQRRIRTRVVRAIIITQESHPSMKFEVFERLNTGSIALNAQEIRNSTHRGPFMQLVKDLVNHRRFREMIGQNKPRRRGADNELVIRFFALADRLEEYRPPQPRFLNSYCEYANRLTESELARLADRFDHGVNNVYSIFGTDAFRITDANAKRVDRSINRALAETQLVSLSRVSPDGLQSKADKLRGALGALHGTQEFLDDIQRATSDRSRTLGRMTQYKKAIEATGAVLI